MSTLYRKYAESFSSAMKTPYVQILFGARQTGKSTLVRSLLPGDATIINLADPLERARFSESPGLFVEICKALKPREGGSVVFVDEAQTVPSIFNSVQYLYDQDRERFRFILCGSSARRLRSAGANLLPGRSLRHVLHPLLSSEYGSPDGGPEGHFPWRPLEERIVFGDLPRIVLESEEDLKANLLKTYATSYLEEEIRRETIVKDWGRFLRFLKFAAGDSGGIVNLSAISHESGVAAPLVKTYYELLEDMFVGFSVPAFSGSVRKSALSSPRFFLFDNGVRNAAAGLPLTVATANADPGRLFEHWVGCQLWRKVSYEGKGRLSYYRTSDGAEVDFVLEMEDEILPIEVKWTGHPSVRDTRHLKTFIREHAPACRRGLVVSRCPYRLGLDDGIEGIPWWEIG
jgi:predicted AAA+ superfamily ATPase